MVQPLWSTGWRLPKKLNTELLYDLAILLLGICPVELKTSIKTCTQISELLYS